MKRSNGHLESGTPTPASQPGHHGLPTAVPADLLWMVGPRLRSCSAVIVNAEATGLLLLADAAPRRGTKVAVRLAWPAPELWAVAVTQAARRTHLGPYEVRLRFDGVSNRRFLAHAIPRIVGWN